MALDGQAIVITGASSGIGRAVARDLHGAGMKLVLNGRREDRLNELAAELGEGCETLAADIVDPALPQKLIDLAVDRFGRCDVVFNNAGVMSTGPIEGIDIDAVCRMARINVEAAYRLMYVALRHFKRVGRGHLLNTSSILGTKVRPTVGAYAGTKYAIEALSESLRLELARTDIKISCIQPGLVLTELHREWETPPAKVLDIKSPLVPEDIARAVRFVLEQPAHVRVPTMLVTPGEQEL